jgi:hypothetical protein
MTKGAQSRDETPVQRVRARTADRVVVGIDRMKLKNVGQVAGKTRSPEVNVGRNIARYLAPPVAAGMKMLLDFRTGIDFALAEELGIVLGESCTGSVEASELRQIVLAECHYLAVHRRGETKKQLLFSNSRSSLDRGG